MDRDLLESLLESPRLPSLPAVAVEVISLVQDEDVSIDRLAAKIQMDAAMAGKILKTANSSLYGLAEPVSTISAALVVLGLNTVKTLALGFSLLGNFQEQPDDGFDRDAYWKRSLYSATSAKVIGTRLSLPFQEEIFLAGLLQDMGIIAMRQVLGSRYEDLLDQAGGHHPILVELERAAFDLDHAAVGAELAQSWNVPEILTVPIRYHEEPEEAPEAFRQGAMCVALGNRVADMFMHEESGNALELFKAGAKEWFGIEEDRVEPLLKEIHEQADEIKRLFALPMGQLDNFESTLARATEQLLSISITTQQETTRLAQENEALAKEVESDALTGVANRRKFNEIVTEAFGLTTQNGVAVSLMFFDADHFKSFNDTYGHQLGDRVLIELAGKITATLPDHATVCRYGGEEFAVILPGTDRKQASKLADVVREAIGSKPLLEYEGESMHVTVSIGVSTHEGQTFVRPEQFIKAADMAVYAAKQAGRNCVRVFTPRVRPAAA
ncbi:sensor domain-containing diguanylate cyclase [Mucisphaera calidilacus]|uniref:diguanylate cyclase n=1 Tax=Mucisphaera calidilacus TaxID=2527982 RepID=A0A518BVC0_9BACT|nr:GGDEF domain-containing protein [Mucisphaera calidilacus]QDU70884.1 Response regulator PleD [Mucisphaera calidilacus]